MYVHTVYLIYYLLKMGERETTTKIPKEPAVVIPAHVYYNLYIYLFRVLNDFYEPVQRTWTKNVEYYTGPKYAITHHVTRLGMAYSLICLLCCVLYTRPHEHCAAAIYAITVRRSNSNTHRYDAP